MKDLSTNAIREEFCAQMSLARSLVDIGESTILESDLGMSRETRGLSMVILFAAYEKLLHSLAREILETTATFRGRRNRLAPGIRILSISSAISSVQNSSDKSLWTTCAPKITDQLNTPANLIDTTIFPNDGSFMSPSQIAVFCDVFAIQGWKATLGKTLSLVSGIRSDRNAVAHGRLTAEIVGRDKTYDEVLEIIDEWDSGWNRFLDLTDQLASNRTYFVSS